MSRKKLRAKTRLYIIIGIIIAAVAFGAYYYYSQQAGFKVYFLKGDRVYPVSRQLTDYDDPLQMAAKYLIDGPTEAEKGRGIYSAIPENARIKSVRKEDKTAYVDFNYALEELGGGAANVQALVGQVVYTFTNISGIDKVKILVDGNGELVLGGEGLVIDQALSRKDIQL